MGQQADFRLCFRLTNYIPALVFLLLTACCSPSNEMEPSEESVTLSKQWRAVSMPLDLTLGGRGDLTCAQLLVVCSKLCLLVVLKD